MGEITKISWCDSTFNPWIGCMKVSPACDGCYAEALMDKRYGRTQWGGPGKGAGTRARTSAGNWHQPIRWNKRAIETGTRPFVFCSSLADVFDNQVPVEWRRDLFDLIRATPNLVWLLLTKRPGQIVPLFVLNEAGRMKQDHEAFISERWPRNAAIGTTVEDQKRGDQNIPHLLHAKAMLRPAFSFLSCEPLLGRLDVSPWLQPGGLDWILAGGETDQGDHKARPSHPDWFRSLRDQCAAAGVPFHHKQNGEWLAWSEIMEDGTENLLSFGKDPARFQYLGQGAIVSKVGKARAGRFLNGIEHNARPEVVTA